jgi:hypothetical protein
MYDPYDHPDAYITFVIDGKSVGQDGDPIVHARTALFGLMYWNAAHTPQTPLPELPDFMKGKLTVFDTGNKCISAEDSETLLTVAASVCERKWNKSPFYFSCPNGDPIQIILNYEDDEARALHFLKWLRLDKEADIIKLKIGGEEFKGWEELLEELEEEKEDENGD